MTREEFRRLALQQLGAVEQAHVGHPDFRVRNKIFATLDYPGPGWAMVKLTATQQEMMIRSEPAMFSPASGAWGRGGATLVALVHADAATVEAALALARGNLPS